MSVKIIEVMLINSIEYNKLFPNGFLEPGDATKIVGKVRKLVEDILFNMFFESAEDDLRCMLIIGEKEKIIKIDISLTDPFYQKHFGNLIPEEREKELNELITRITNKLDNIDWRDVLK